MSYVLNGKTYLTGDGSYGFAAEVDGVDLVVTGVRATCFGGKTDPDAGDLTAAGLSTDTLDLLMGCALPMSGVSEATEGSPIPALPFLSTYVQVFNPATGARIQVPVVDVGPARPPAAHAAIDLTRQAMIALGGDPGADMSGSLDDIAYRVFGAARRK